MFRRHKNKNKGESTGRTKIIIFTLFVRTVNGLTDKVERFFEILFQIGMAVVQDRQAFVDNAAVIGGRRRGRLLASGHVQDARYPVVGHAVPVVRVLAVAEVQERQDFGQRMGVHQFPVVLRVATADGAHRRRCQQRIFAHVLVPGMEFFVATCGLETNSDIVKNRIEIRQYIS